MEIYTEGLNKIQNVSASGDLARLVEQSKGSINARVLSVSALNQSTIKALLVQLEQHKSNVTGGSNNALATVTDSKTSTQTTAHANNTLMKLLNSFPAAVIRDPESFQKTLSEMSLVKLALAQPQLKPLDALLSNKLLTDASVKNTIQIGQKISISMTNDGILKFTLNPSQNKNLQSYLNQARSESPALATQTKSQTLQTRSNAIESLSNIQTPVTNKTTVDQALLIKNIVDTLRNTLPNNSGPAALHKLISQIPPSDIQRITSQIKLLGSSLNETQAFGKNITNIASTSLQRIQNITNLATVNGNDIQRATTNSTTTNTSALQDALHIAHSNVAHKPGLLKSPALQASVIPPTAGTAKEIDSDLQILVHAYKTLVSLSSTLESKPSLALDNFLKAIFILFKPKATKGNTASLEARNSNLSQLETTIRSAITHAITAQLKSALKTLSEPQSPMYYFAEIPARFNDAILPIGIHIYEKYNREDKKKEAEKKSKKDQKKKWTLNLEWTIPEYGEFKAEINYSNKALNTAIWAEKKSLRRQIREKLPSLKNTLAKLGIDVEQLTCLETRPADQHKPTMQTSLVDITT